MFSFLAVTMTTDYPRASSLLFTHTFDTSAGRFDMGDGLYVGDRRFCVGDNFLRLSLIFG